MAVALQDHPQIEFITQPGHTLIILLAVGEVEHRLFAIHHRLQRLQRGVGFMALGTRQGFLRVPACVVQRLPRQRDGTHDRIRINAGTWTTPALSLKRQVLRHPRLQHHVFWVGRLCHTQQRALPAKHPHRGCGEHCGKTLLTRGLDLIRAPVEQVGDMQIRAHRTILRGEAAARGCHGR